jgi:hypothetical protein
LTKAVLPLLGRRTTTGRHLSFLKMTIDILTDDCQLRFRGANEAAALRDADGEIIEAVRHYPIIANLHANSG